MAQAKVDPKTVCLICKQPPSPARPGDYYAGKGTNQMRVSFYLCDACAAPYRIDGKRAGA